VSGGPQTATRLRASAAHRRAYAGFEGIGVDVLALQKVVRPLELRVVVEHARHLTRRRHRRGR
jgi:hypothetical protein